MKKFSGYEDAAKNANRTSTPKLPAGIYICKILGVKLVEDKGYMKVQFDVEEGEYKGFFKKQYDESKDENKKFKGITTVWVPKDDGSENDARTKDTFARWTTSLENSNNGYTWDWDEQKWKGKKIALAFGEVGKNIEGKNVRYTECRWPMSVESAKSGKAKVPEFKAYPGYSATDNSTQSNPTGFTSMPDSLEAELPF